MIIPIENANLQRRITVRCESEYRKRPEWIHPQSPATIGAKPNYFMVDFVEESWFASFQNLTSARIEAEWMSSATHVRWVGPKWDGQLIFYFYKKILFSEAAHF